jgi:hypothetical protein
MKIKSKSIFSMSISFKAFDLYLQKTTLFILLCSKAYDRKKSRLTAPYKIPPPRRSLFLSNFPVPWNHHRLGFISHRDCIRAEWTFK